METEKVIQNKTEREEKRKKIKGGQIENNTIDFNLII